MAEQQIILTIDEEGAITAKTQGFKGEACLDAVAELLGQELNVVSIRKTDEYFQENKPIATRVVTAKQGEL